MVVYNHLDYLTDDTQGAAKKLWNKLDAKGLHPHIDETYRSEERQNKIWQVSQSLVAAGQAPLTKTQHGWHPTGRAIDWSISPATLDNIIFFLQSAQDIGFRTLHDPAQVQADRAAGKTPDLWDWHHVEYRNNRTWKQAIAEYHELAAGRKVATVNFGSVVGSLLSLGAISSALKE